MHNRPSDAPSWNSPPTVVNTRPVRAQTADERLTLQLSATQPHADQRTHCSAGRVFEFWCRVQERCSRNRSSAEWLPGRSLGVFSGSSDGGSPEVFVHPVSMTAQHDTTLRHAGGVRRCREHSPAWRLVALPSDCSAGGRGWRADLPLGPVSPWTRRARSARRCSPRRRQPNVNARKAVTGKSRKRQVMSRIRKLCDPYNRIMPASIQGLFACVCAVDRRCMAVR